jgi:hypothetical protein
VLNGRWELKNIGLGVKNGEGSCVEEGGDEEKKGDYEIIKLFYL